MSTPSYYALALRNAISSLGLWRLGRLLPVPFIIAGIYLFLAAGPPSEARESEDGPSVFRTATEARPQPGYINLENLPQLLGPAGDTFTGSLNRLENLSSFVNDWANFGGRGGPQPSPGAKWVSSR